MFPRPLVPLDCHKRAGQAEQPVEVDSPAQESSQIVQAGAASVRCDQPRPALAFHARFDQATLDEAAEVANRIASRDDPPRLLPEPPLPPPQPSPTPSHRQPP